MKEKNAIMFLICSGDEKTKLIKTSLIFQTFMGVQFKVIVLVLKGKLLVGFEILDDKEGNVESVDKYPLPVSF